MKWFRVTKGTFYFHELEVIKETAQSVKYINLAGIEETSRKDNDLFKWFTDRDEAVAYAEETGSRKIDVLQKQIDIIQENLGSL
jgi:hypothetical protein